MIPRPASGKMGGGIPSGRYTPMETIEGVAFERVIDIPYDPEQKRLYQAKRRSSIYHPHRLRLGRGKEGRQSSGLFAEIAVRAALKENGCMVLISEPRVPDGFVVAHYPGYREREDPPYTRMFEYFDRDQLERFNAIADRKKIESDRKEIKAKRKKAKNPTRGGGDPDLFVVRGDGSRFFVEVKGEGDKLRAKQGVVFPLIRKMLRCEVWLAQLRAVPGAKLSDFALPQ